MGEMFGVRQDANWQKNYPEDGERKYWVYFGRLEEETSIFEGYPFPEVECRLEIRFEDAAHMVHNESLKSAYGSDLKIEHCGHPSMRRK